VNLSAAVHRAPTVATTLHGVRALRRRRRRLPELPVAPLPKQIDLPTVNVQATLARRQPPRTMASLGGDAARAPLRPHRRPHRHDVDVDAGRDQPDVAVRSRSQRRGRRTRRAGRHHAALGRPAANLPTRPTYRKVNPSDAPILILALTSDTCRSAASTTPPTRSWRRRSRRSPAVGPGLRRRRPDAGGSACRSIPRRSPASA